MADVFCDMSLSTGSNNGTTWANAYQALATALNGSNVGSGDICYVQGAESVGAVTVTGPTGSEGDPAIVLGVKDGTTNEPPVQSDLCPGWRTGKDRTPANRAYNDPDTVTVPRLTSSGAITVNGGVYFYGINFTGTSLGFVGDGDGYRLFEECEIEFTAGAQLRNTAYFETVNCQWKGVGGGSTNFTSVTEKQIHRGLILSMSSVMTTMIVRAEGLLHLIGCDFSAEAHTTILQQNQETGGVIIIQNCQFHANTALTTSTPTSTNRMEIYGSGSTTGKSSGSIQNIDIVTSEGDITEETTAVRTGGADDGEAGGHSMAMTPIVNRTHDQYHSLVGPWMAVWVTNSITTVDVFIANSGSSDYNDDDVWLEIYNPSEGGTQQHTHDTTQMLLLGTPAAVTDDTASTWGSGGNNPQKLSVTISPDYSGWAYCRVHFAKNFGSSPETLYVDPNPVAS